MIEPPALRQVALFSNLLPEHAQRGSSIVEQVTHPPSTKLFGDGEAVDPFYFVEFYFVVSGKVRINKQIPSMGEEALSLLGPGEHFGEMALMDEAPRSVDAITSTTRVLGRA